jgi:hypothetical protein
METLLQSVERKQTLEEEKFVQLSKLLGIRTFKFTELEAPYDVKFRWNNQLYIGEIKNRDDKPIDYFKDNGPFLELTKINGMYKEQQYLLNYKNIDIEMVYINFCSDGVLIYRLYTPWSYQFEWRYLPKDNYNKDVKIHKLVSNLNRIYKTIKYD